MKKFFLFLLCLAALAFIITYFIPSVRKKEAFIGNTFENIISSIMRPKNWIQWDPAVRQAWEKDSSACSFKVDGSGQVATIGIPGKTITITQITSLLYKFEETRNNQSSFFILSIIPYVGNEQARSNHNSTVTYAQDSRLLYKAFPAFEKGTFSETTLSNLKGYLENAARFYGFPIEIKPAPDTLFVTRKTALLKQHFFKTIPVIFDSLRTYCERIDVQPGAKNIFIATLSPDSIEVLAGININKKIDGDYLHSFMQLPSGQILVVGHFEGRYGDKQKVYEAMEKFISDHQLLKGSVSYEKYSSPLPVSDSSLVKIELSYPLRY